MKNTSVEGIMTKNVECIHPNQKLVDVKHIYEKLNFHHHIPVVENDELIGMVSLIDFIHKIGETNLDDNNAVYNNFRVSDIMSYSPISLPVNSTIRDVAKILAVGEIHAVPIVNGKKVVGIVSTADVIRYSLESE